MSRIKPTPLLIVSVGLIIYAFYILFTETDTGGWGQLLTMVFMVAGILGLAIYAILRVVLGRFFRTS